MRIIGVAFITAITAVILMLLVDALRNTLNIFTTITSVTGVENGLLKILLKIVGVGYVTEFGAGILNDFGSHSIADKVVLCGKVTIVALSIPVIESLLQLVGGFLKLV